MAAPELRDYQEEFVGLIRGALRSVRSVVGVLQTGGGKCLGAGTPILMFDGSIKMVEHVDVGDLLMGPDSQPRLVTSLARGREMMYRVTPVKGDAYTVNQSHILSLKISGHTTDMTGGDGLRYRGGDICNISVSDYLKSKQSFRHVTKGWRVGVDFPNPANDNDLPVPPYILGVWLGDGSANLAAITNMDEEVLDAWISWGKSLGCKHRVELQATTACSTHHLSGIEKTGRRGGGNGALNALRSTGVIGNKHIPKQYLTASRECRIQLLAGLLDADGFLHHNSFELVTNRKALADGVAFLARSLSLACYVKPCAKVCTNTGASGDYYRLTISGNVDTIPCRVPRRQASRRRQVKDALVTGISIEQLGEGEYFGFEVAGPDRLFLLGDFTVTHNTVCFSKIASGIALRGKVVWILAHRREIISQISMSISQFDVHHQVVANDKTVRRLISRQYVERGESFVVPVSNVVVASVQTLVNRIGSMPLPDYIIIDECHHVTPGSSWGRVVAANPSAKIIGVTATPCRLDGKGLGVAAGGYFEALVEGISASELIERGFLCQYRVYTPGNIDVSGLRKRGGDYADGELESLVDKPAITGNVVEHYKEICNGERAVVFSVSVRHAQHVADAFIAGGVSAAVLTGEMDEDTRNDVLEAYTAGRITVLCTVDIVSEGFDLPAITAVILLRPTASFSLYRQQVGRALRTFAGKAFAYLIDHVGNWDRHGPPDAEVVWSLDGVVKSPREMAEQAEPMKVCPKCFYVHDPAPVCPGCGHVYQATGRELKERDGVLVELTKEEIKAAKEKAKAAKKKAVSKAKTLEELEAIAEKFGYSPGWAEHTFRARRQVEARYRKQSRY